MSRRAGIALAVFAAAAMGMGMGKSPTAQVGPAEFIRYHVEKITTQDGDGSSFALTATGPLGTTVFTEKDLGCFKLSYGPNLASCFRSCDGKTALTLTAQPDYLDGWASSEQLRWTGAVTRSVQPGANEKDVALTAKFDLGKWEVEPDSADAGICGQAAAAFDGDACLKETAEAIFSGEPVVSYLDELKKVQSPSLDGMISRLESLKSALESHGLKKFDRQGEFLAENLRNAPTLICQIKSRQLLSEPRAGSDETLQAALEDDLSELDRSVEFLARLPKAEARR